MPEVIPAPTLAVRLRRLAAALALLLPTPGLAQYIGTAPPPPLPPAPRPGEIETPAAALARAVRTLAQSPRDFSALIRAGRAALDLGDDQAAIGFFARADEVRPTDPAPKIGIGAATVSGGDAAGALRWFYQAQQLGATDAALGADRGLAQDLLGNQAAAQADYRAALAGPEADEARRRLALSLGISGDRAGAFTILQPLLNRRDPASQRVRAFVLALVGDERGASGAIDSAMPGAGPRMAGFFRLLPSLSAPQKAAAVHLGVFPDPSAIRVAAVSPRLVAPRASTPTPAPTRAQPMVAAPVLRQPATPVATPALKVGSVAWAPTMQPAPAAGTTVSPPKPAFSPPATAQEPAKPLTMELPSQKAAASAAPPSLPAQGGIVAVAGDRLSGIDRLLAQADELPVPPPPPRPRFEKPTKNTAADSQASRAADLNKASVAKKAVEAKKTAELKKAAEAKKAADAKKLADAKKAAEEKEAREAIGIAGTYWVQLAGGAHADRMAVEFRRLSAKSSALRRKGGAVTSGKDYFRLLTGPFADRSEAQAFVNSLAKDGVDGFSWTRTPATIRIEKLSPK